MSRHRKFLLLIISLAAFLRLWGLSKVPVSLFEDELDVGYHAYSILKTGKDYSGNSWPLHFESLADLRTPFNIYSTVPTVAIFGINAWGVRLPVAFFGIIGVWGMYLLVGQLLGCELRVMSYKRKINTQLITRNALTALAASLILAVSPWHIQYSRVALEVSQLLAFLIFGLYFFFKSISQGAGPRRDSITSSAKQNLLQNDTNGKWLWVSVACLTFTPLIYSTAKLFTPILMLLIFILWKKEIFKIPKKYLKRSFLALVIFGLLTVYATLFSGGGYRFKYISIFTDPTTSTQVDFARFHDANFRDEIGLGTTPQLGDKFFHNKIVSWTKSFTNNYFQAFSTDFLFINGDPNLRHSIKNMGQFYKLEFLAMFLGVALFFSRFKNRKIKIFIALWILFGVVPSAITRIGGNHATRLIIILPPLVFLTAYGLVEGLSLVKKVRWRNFFAISYFGIWILSFGFYLHNYLVHYPWDSERLWHAGYRKVIDIAKKYESQYQKIVITNAIENPLIFFAAYYEYDPVLWHEGTKFGQLEGFGDVEYIGKFYFGQVLKNDDIRGLSEALSDDILYIAAAKEIEANLIMEPEKTPPGIILIEAVQYPSGEPAFYAFAGK